jgi:hypothetical protein
MTRFLASVPGYVYAKAGSTIYVNLFAEGTADIRLDGGRTVALKQQTRYPWDGQVTITVTPDRAADFTLDVRIPGWARNQPVPSDLYRFLDAAADPVVLKVNGAAVPLAVDRGYVALRRTWRPGDVVSLVLPMPVRRVVAHDRVEADRDRVALQRGPIVYAAEWPDSPGKRVRNLMLPDTSALTAEYRTSLLNGVTVVTGRAFGLAYDAAGKIARTEQPFTAIPYYAWANRGRGEMLVWIPRAESAARPTPWPTVATTSTVSVSGKSRRNPRMINDGEDPPSSVDPASYFDWWPTKGTTEWVEYAFQKPATVSEVAVYWFDDTGQGEVRVPASWRILYRDGDEWKPVTAHGPYGVERDRYNRVTFAPLTTSALRLELTMQPKWSAGLQEWKVK